MTTTCDTDTETTLAPCVSQAAWLIASSGPRHGFSDASRGHLAPAQEMWQRVAGAAQWGPRSASIERTSSGYSRVKARALKGNLRCSSCASQACGFADRPGLRVPKPVVLILGCKVPHEYHAALKSIRQLIDIRSCVHLRTEIVGGCFENHAKRLPGRAWYVLYFPSCASSQSSPVWGVAESVKRMNSSYHRPLSITYILADLFADVAGVYVAVRSRPCGRAYFGWTRVAYTLLFAGR